MLFSVLILRVRYRTMTVLGALGILLGAVVTVLPPILFPARGAVTRVQMAASTEMTTAPRRRERPR